MQNLEFRRTRWRVCLSRRCGVARAACWAEAPLARAENNSSCGLIRGPASSIIEKLLDLIDRLFNSSEKRLARLLLLLANFGKEGRPEPIVGKFSQEMLVDMIGTTRSHVSKFMNKFRELGFISYNGTIEVHSSPVRRAPARSATDQRER